MKVSIIGQGYVGLTISAFAAKHYEVVGFDLNSTTVSQLNKGISHVEGVASEDIKHAIFEGKYRATIDGSEIVGSNIVVIAVPTPLDVNRKPDLSYIDSACKVIGENLRGPALIINESTSFPGTIRNYIKPAIEKYS
jgi:UDP-N-acetyl-D-glucosamine dehydrogenase